MKFLLLVFLLLIFFTSALKAESFAPWSVSDAHPTFDQLSNDQEKIAAVDLLNMPALALIFFFQKFISPANGASCNFLPSCSGYALSAIGQQGLFLGIGLAGERLLRDHHCDSCYQRRLIAEQLYYLDPLEDNIFWRDKQR